MSQTVRPDGGRVSASSAGIPLSATIGPFLRSRAGPWSPTRTPRVVVGEHSLMRAANFCMLNGGERGVLEHPKHPPGYATVSTNEAFFPGERIAKTPPN